MLTLLFDTTNDSLDLKKKRKNIAFVTALIRMQRNYFEILYMVSNKYIGLVCTCRNYNK